MTTIIGDTSTLIITTSKYNTFCSLCTRRIYEGEECKTWADRKFFLHNDCGLVTDRMTKVSFLQLGKRRNRRKSK